jgi:hypothetical protein
MSCPPVADYDTANVTLPTEFSNNRLHIVTLFGSPNVANGGEGVNYHGGMATLASGLGRAAHIVEHPD